MVQYARLKSVISKTNMLQKLNIHRTLSPVKRVAMGALIGLLVLTSILSTHGFGAFAASCSSQSDCQAQIDSLNAQTNDAQSSLSNLEAQAGSYQAAISVLQSQIDSLNSQIADNQAQQANLQAQIDTAQAELTRQRAGLSQDLKAMYVTGQLSTVEMLATSKNLSDFVDASTYATAVQNKIQSTVAQITALQNQLKQQKAQLDQLLATLSTQQAQAAAAQQEQANLLSYNESQQASFNAQIKTNQQALSQLYAQQAAIIAASFGGGFHYGGTGGYPYADAACLNSDGNCGASGGYPYGPYAWGYPPSSFYDGAGWGYRNCTGYAFWRLAQTTGITLTAGYFPATYNSGGRIKYSVLGGDFQNQGYRVDSDPNGAAVLAVNTIGNFGHIMYVESVINGQPYVSQYNAGSDGRYSTGILTNLSGIYFVHIR